MLKTPEERVRLLKKGIKSKTIEELYIRHNKIKIIQSPILFDLFENYSNNNINSPDIPAIELKRNQIPDRYPISISVFAIASLSAISG